MKKPQSHRSGFFIVPKASMRLSASNLDATLASEEPGKA
jgi:hypothetical protein